MCEREISSDKLQSGAHGDIISKLGFIFILFFSFIPGIF
jgi:hypothetical protein